MKFKRAKLDIDEEAKRAKMNLDKEAKDAKDEIVWKNKLEMQRIE